MQIVNGGGNHSTRQKSKPKPNKQATFSHAQLGFEPTQ